MKTTATLLLTLPALLASQAAAWSHIPDAGSLKEALETNDFTLVAFIHPDEENSKSLEPEWTTLQSKDATGHITSIDCSPSSTETSKLCSSLAVSSFPTIRLYHRSGRIDRYRGPRHAGPIKSFLHRMLRPTAVAGYHLSYITAENTTAFLLSDDVVFVGHFRSPSSPSKHHHVKDNNNNNQEEEEEATNKSLRERFAKAAEKYHDRFSFAISLLDDHHHQHGGQQQQDDTEEEEATAITCYNIPDELQRSISVGELQSHPGAMDLFVRTCSTPLIPELTRRNEVSYYQSGKSLVHYLTTRPSQRDSYAKAMLPLAKKYSEYLQFTTTDVNEYPEAAEMLGLRRGTKTGLSVQNPSNGDVFPYTGREQISAEVVEGFLVDIIQGRVKPWSRGRQGGGGGHEEL